MAATSTQLLSLSWSAVRRRAWLVVPFVIGETLASLFMLVPLLVVLARAWALAGGRWETLPFGLLKALTDSQTLWTASYALLFAIVVAWFVRGLLHAGALGTLGQAVGSPQPEDDSAFSDAILRAPERWLASMGVLVFFRALMSICIIGSVVSGMWFFANAPGALSALVMTIACAMVVTWPLLAVALELAYARVVLLGEGPFDSIANAMEQAFRRRDALIPAWVALVLVDLGLSFFTSVASTALNGAPSPSIQVLLLGPQAFASIVFWALGSTVLLLRLGLYSALVGEDAGTVVVASRKTPAKRTSLPRVLTAVPVTPADETR